MKPYWDEDLCHRHDPEWETFSWLSLQALFSSVNDILARGASAYVDDTRQRWVAAQRAAGIEARFPGLIIDQGGLREPSFLILGDPGEADDSQYAVVKPLLERGKGTDFMVICSDVVYPAGDVNDYVNAFYVPYRNYKQPIYALPGNHDWYDGLSGFMYHFCAADPLPDVSHNRASYRGREWLARRVWRKAHAPKRALIATYRRRTSRPTTTFRTAAQPGPYFAIDAGPLLLVAIDTGVTGELDREQGDWLREISTHDKPKILLTGKPIHVDNKTEPGPIEDNPKHPEALRYVDEIVRDEKHRYVAVIGGDVHNYQRYESTDTAGNPLASLVSGGGGAYLSNTHRIPPTMEDDQTTRLVYCYPTRAQSIRVYARRFVPALWRSLLTVLALIVAALAAALSLLLVEGPPSWIVGIALAAGAVAVIALRKRGTLGVGEARARPATRAQGRQLISAALSGAALVYVAAWLLEGRLGLAVLLWLGIVVLVSALAAFDNASVERVKAGWLIVSVLIVGAVLGSAFALARAEDAAWELVAALCIPLALLLPAAVHASFRFFYPRAKAVASEFPKMLPTREEKRPSQPPYRWAFTYLSAPVALILIVTLAIWQPRAAAAVALVALTLAYLIALPIVAFLARRRSRQTAWLYVWAVAILGPVLAVVAAAWLDEGLLVRVPLATLCALLATVAGVTWAYLVWLRALPLLWHWGDRDGEIEDSEAAAHVHERWDEVPLDVRNAADEKDVDSLPRVSDRTKRIIRMVTPPGAGRSIVHKLVSEIFEPVTPPLYKSFVRVDTTASGVTICAYGVTGAKDKSSGELVDTVEISLVGR